MSPDRYPYVVLTNSYTCREYRKMRWQDRPHHQALRYEYLFFLLNAKRYFGPRLNIRMIVCTIVTTVAITDSITKTDDTIVVIYVVIA